MKKRNKNILTVITILALTAIVMLIFQLIPGYAQPVNEFIQPKFWIVFIIVNLILIGIPAWIHRTYINDYSGIKKIWFFALFGGITGGLLGERSFIMIIPYIILMLLYAFLYKKFVWWKIALTSYLAGILLENGLNHAPIQSTTLIWVAFFIYPYFITKIWENRKKLRILWILNDLKYTLISSILLAILALLISRNNLSPPLIIFGFALPFFITIAWRFLRRKSKLRKI